MKQEESDNESTATNAVTEIETKTHIWSGTSGNLGRDLVRFNVEEIMSEDK